MATLREADEVAASDGSVSREVARLNEVADIGEGAEDDDNGEFSNHRVKKYINTT